MTIRERLQEEFEIEDEDQALQDYRHITSLLSVNYSLMADELGSLTCCREGLVVDLGCGLGDLGLEIAKRYPKLSVAGVDISQKAIDEAARRAKAEGIDNVSFELQDVHSLSFADRGIDIVVSHGSIHHWRDVSTVFSQIYRVLKPAGLAYLTDLNREAPEDIVEEVKSGLPESQAKGFINSVHAAYTCQELKEILNKLNIDNCDVSQQHFSRATIFKNRQLLRAASSRKADFNKLSHTVIIRKAAG